MQIELSEQDIQTIADALSQQPWIKVNEVIHRLDRQVQIAKAPKDLAPQD